MHFRFFNHNPGRRRGLLPISLKRATLLKWRKCLKTAVIPEKFGKTGKNILFKIACLWAHEHHRYSKSSIENRLQCQFELSTYGVIKKVGVNLLCWGLKIDKETPSGVTAAAPHLLLFFAVLLSRQHQLKVLKTIIFDALIS